MAYSYETFTNNAGSLAPNLTLTLKQKYPAMSPLHPRKFQHFLTFQDYSAFEITNLIAKTVSIKSTFKKTKGQMDPFLAQKTLAILFTKPSTRTRVSAETGWAAYGGHPLFLGI